MSTKIEQLLEVIEEVRKAHYMDNEQPIKTMRFNAAAAVATRWKVDHSTINDKWIRGLDLGSDFNYHKTWQFDELLSDWLIDGSSELKDVLLNHSIDSGDKKRIDDVFGIASDTDLLVSYEFELNPSEQSFVEGKPRLKIHLTKERNPYLVEEAKKRWEKEFKGNMRCFICSFSFQDNYGSRGQNFIEAHHLKPISSLTENEVVTISDLAPVCSNCHRMLHRTKPWLSVEELKEIFEENQKM